MKGGTKLKFATMLDLFMCVCVCCSEHKLDGAEHTEDPVEEYVDPQVFLQDADQDAGVS